MIDRTNPFRLPRALVACVLCGAAALAPAVARADKSVLMDRVVALVDDTPIYRSDVIARARPLVAQLSEAEKKPDKMNAMYHELLQMMVDEILIGAEAQKMQLSVSDEEVNRALEAIAAGNKLSRAELEAAVKKTGLSLEDYREVIRRQVVEAKWTQLKVRTRLKPPDPKLSEADREKALMAALEVERRKAMTELRDRSSVEVRW